MLEAIDQRKTRNRVRNELLESVSHVMW